MAKKIHNAASGWKAKVEIRRHVLEEITPAAARVFDAFAGPGLMWAEVWKHAAAYVGCDERWHADSRCCFVADNRRVMRTIDLSPFNVFDLDAFGSPWDQAIILAARRRMLPDERLGLVVTEGSFLHTRSAGPTSNHGWPPGLMQATGIAGMAANMSANSFHDELIGRGLRNIVRKMGGRIVRQWRAVGTTGAGVRYLGLVIEGGVDA